MLSQGRASCSSKRAPLPQHEVVCTADSATCHQQALSVRTQPQAQPSSAAAVGELEGRAAPDCGPHQAVDQLKGRLQQLQVLGACMATVMHALAMLSCRGLQGCPPRGRVEGTYHHDHPIMQPMQVWGTAWPLSCEVFTGAHGGCNPSVQARVQVPG